MIHRLVSNFFGKTATKIYANKIKTLVILETSNNHYLGDVQKHNSIKIPVQENLR